MPQGLKIVCSIILQGSRLRRTGGTPNDTDVVNGLHTIFETGLKVFILGKAASGVQGKIRLKPRDFGDFQRYPYCAAMLNK